MPVQAIGQWVETGDEPSPVSNLQPEQRFMPPDSSGYALLRCTHAAVAVPRIAKALGLGADDAPVIDVKRFLRV